MPDAHVMTVLGPVEPAALGTTSCHEHILLDLTVWNEPPTTEAERALADAPVTIERLGELTRDPLFLNQDNYRLFDAGTATKEVKAYRQAGGSAIVDLTTDGLSPDPLALRRISLETGLHIIAGCGFYVNKSHPAWLSEATEAEVAARLVQDLVTGFAGTDIRAGVIGELGTSERIYPREEKVLRAAAEAQQVTGASINVHTNLFSPQGCEALDILEAAGADLSRVAISHVDHGALDLDYQRSLLERGAWVEYDGFGKEWYIDSRETWFPRDVERVRAIEQLVREGRGDRILLGCDVCVKIQLLKYGGWGYRHLPLTVLPWLRRLIGDEWTRRLAVWNPQTYLAIDGAEERGGEPS